MRKLIDQSDAEVFTMVGDDDYFEPTFLAEMKALLDRRPDASMVTSTKRYVDQFGDPSGRVFRFEPRLYIPPLTLDPFNIYEGFCVRRSVYDRAPGWIDWADHKALGGDLDLFLQLEELGPIVTLESELYVKRHHSQNLSLEIEEHENDALLRRIIQRTHMRRVGGRELTELDLDRLVSIAKMLEFRETAGAGPRRPGSVSLQEIRALSTG